MSLSVAYGALLTGVILWLVLVRKFSARPWEHSSPNAAVSVDHEPPAPARIGLWVFLGVVTSLFGLFISAYTMRMGHGHGGALHDWHPVIEPKVLWINTAALILASIAMQWARMSIRYGSMRHTRDGLLLGGLLTFVFLAGQWYAWRQLQGTGALRWSDPATAFFYVLTAVHGIHLLGGLFVWGKTIARLWRQQTEVINVRLSVELCTVYWHYLLLVWVVLFGLLLST